MCPNWELNGAIFPFAVYGKTPNPLSNTIQSTFTLEAFPKSFCTYKNLTFKAVRLILVWVKIALKAI